MVQAAYTKNLLPAVVATATACAGAGRNCTAVQMMSRYLSVPVSLQAFVQRAGYDYVRLDGSTPQKARQPLVDQFNGRHSIFLFLMSTVAGGVGINLTAANKVVS